MVGHQNLTYTVSRLDWNRDSSNIFVKIVVTKNSSLNIRRFLQQLIRKIEMKISYTLIIFRCKGCLLEHCPSLKPLINFHYRTVYSFSPLPSQYFCIQRIKFHEQVYVWSRSIFGKSAALIILHAPHWKWHAGCINVVFFVGNVVAFRIVWNVIRFYCVAQIAVDDNNIAESNTLL